MSDFSGMRIDRVGSQVSHTSKKVVEDRVQTTLPNGLQRTKRLAEAVDVCG